MTQLGRPDFCFPLGIREARHGYGVRIRVGSSPLPWELLEDAVVEKLGFHQLTPYALHYFGVDQRDHDWYILGEARVVDHAELSGWSGQLAALMALGTREGSHLAISAGFLGAGTVWMTGDVLNVSTIAAVEEIEFELKVEAFMASQSRLFLVPLSNWRHFASSLPTSRGESPSAKILSFDELLAGAGSSPSPWTTGSPLDHWIAPVPEDRVDDLVTAVFPLAGRRAPGHGAGLGSSGVVLRPPAMSTPPAGWSEVVAACEVKPGDPGSARRLLALCRGAADRILAREVFKRTLLNAVVSARPAVARRYAEGLDTAGDSEGGAWFWREALELDPSDAEAFSRVTARLRRSGDHRGLAGVLARRLDLPLDDIERKAFLRERAEALDAVPDLEGAAQRAWEELLLEDPHDPRAVSRVDHLRQGQSAVDISTRRRH